MPPYGSLHSPSLRKMEHSRSYGRKGIQLGNILGDPFALATISISLLAWFIAFISSIISQTQATDADRFPPYAWWAIVYSLFLIAGVFVVVASDSVHTYHVAVTGYLAGGMVLVTSSVSSLVYSKSGAREAAAAGFILLSMVMIVWIFYFGSTPSSTPRAFLDSFALGKDTGAVHNQAMNGYGGTGRPETSNSVQQPQMYTSAQLNGFENPSPVGGTSSQANGPRGSAIPTGFGSSSVPQPQPGKPNDAEVVPPTEYPYRAKAIYSYEANPDDANEISFAKHEILEVSDVSGRWWQARKENGETGIAPSNYLILL
ncbi:High osmolarity signaling protein SHO1 [Tolypocladium ophioglossoides CBS 100239]|uniref:High osmolarity signaling protein SHO1 n=1 Tax=Tolypocladium ophioglossoides (strain CBS 100239) TaxID=1163406 RepID=A0A0L0N1W8_TOLOC|nr:High osmolarity signaling protein SHO1 [Tolypocladium ophioglossoides CBS 100239]